MIFATFIPKSISTFSLCVFLVCLLPVIYSKQPNNEPTRKTQFQPNVKFSLPSNTEVMIQSGKHEYELLMEKKNNPIYGMCWANAIGKLERSCKNLDEYRQSWLSILFTHCFLKTLGSENLSPQCKKITDFKVGDTFSDMLVPQIKDCATSIVHSNIFHTYSLFFVHTQSICFYLQSEQWQQHTEHLVDSLVNSAHEVSNDLNSAVNKIRELEELQNSSLQAQLSINGELSQAKINLEKFQQQTKEQRDLIERIINQFTLLQQFLIDEFSTNSAIVYYIFSMLVIYFATTPTRTIGARLILYILLIISFILERNALDYIIKFDYLVKSKFYLQGDNTFVDYSISRNVWVIRKFMLLIMASTYVWWILTYRDISQINFRMLNENTVLLRSIYNQINKTPEVLNYKQIKQSGYSEYSDYSDLSESSYSNYESEDDSFISTDFDSDFENNSENRKYNLRSCSKGKVNTSFKSLPNEYKDESVTDFVRNVRNSIKNEKLNFYSSDEN